MKFATVETKNGYELVVQKNEQVISLKSLGYFFKDMNELIERITDDQISSIKICLDNNEGEMIEHYQWRAPIMYPKQDILCLGQNYAAHAEESARYKKEAFSLNKEAVYFSKRVNRATGHLEMIDSHSNIVSDLDYECELAVIIRNDCMNVKKENVKDFIFGYTILNDVSARTIQTSHKQWYFGKSLDTFTVMGPVIVTADEFEWPLSLNVNTTVNGELRQNGNTRDLIFDIEHIIHELTQGMTLKSGTIIATGTPSGVGMGMNPPQFLKTGDFVECYIENIGKLSNTIQ